MAKQQRCYLPCANEYPLALEFLTPPDELDIDYELDTRDWTQWATLGRSYGRVETGSGREFQMAAQIHGLVDAVITAPWGSVSRQVTNNYAIKVNSVYYQIIAAINVDEMNSEMKFICRKVMQ